MGPLLSAAIGAAFLLLYLWQDGIQPCNDGRRYTSGEPQPSPFHRRFCGWPPLVLVLASWAGLLFICATLGAWWRALLFAALPGVWFCTTRPTTVDGAAMALAWASSLLLPAHPVAAVALALAGGFMHERAPVFAALYAWHPLPLLGLLAVGWWRRPAPPDHDVMCGLPSFGAVVKAHRPYHDWLDWKGWILPTKAIIPLAAWAGAPAPAWAALAVATASRIVGSDTARFVLWGVPPLLAALAEQPPGWALAVHALVMIRLP